MKLNFQLKSLFVFALLLSIGMSCTEQTDTPSTTSLFRIGYKTESSSTGPLVNSGFIFRLNDTSTPIFLTAHHVVAVYDGGNKFLDWNKLDENVKDCWLGNQYDSSINLPLGKNIPVRGARTSHLDLAAFEIESSNNTTYLKPSPASAQVSDTVQQFSKLLFDNSPDFTHPAKVVYTTDSIFVYEFIASGVFDLSGTSGSPVLNKNNEVVALSFGSLTFPNQQVKDKVALELPFVNNIHFENYKTYGIGIPVALIKANIGH